jgi:hypothetical protein
MDVIGHQTVGVHGTAGFSGEISQARQVHKVVGVLPEALPPIMPALHDVERDVRYDEAGLPWHKRHNGRQRWQLTDWGSVPDLIRAPSPM